MHEDINTKATSLVRNALEEAGLEDRLLVLSETARSAEEAAKAIGVEVGAIVKTLIFTIEEVPIAALISGDRQCNMESLPGLLGKEGKRKTPQRQRSQSHHRLFHRRRLPPRTKPQHPHIS